MGTLHGGLRKSTGDQWSGDRTCQGQTKKGEKKARLRAQEAFPLKKKKKGGKKTASSRFRDREKGRGKRCFSRYGSKTAKRGGALSTGQKEEESPRMAAMIEGYALPRRKKREGRQAKTAPHPWSRFCRENVFRTAKEELAFTSRGTEGGGEEGGKQPSAPSSKKEEESDSCSKKGTPFGPSRPAAPRREKKKTLLLRC